MIKYQSKYKYFDRNNDLNHFYFMYSYIVINIEKYFILQKL